MALNARNITRCKQMEDSGSGHLDFNQTVGMVTNPQQCTGGFTVRTIATPRDYGLLTAGHCKSNNTQFGYQEAGGGITTATLTYQNEKFDADSDLAWCSPAVAHPTWTIGSMPTPGAFCSASSPRREHWSATTCASTGGGRDIPVAWWPRRLTTLEASAGRA